MGTTPSGDMESSGSHPAASVAPAPARSAAPVLAGDLLVVVGVLVAGELSHGVSPISDPLLVLDTLVPFLVGWVLVAALLGAYDAEALSGSVASVRVGAGAWIGAANVGLILRGSPYFHGGVTWPFPLVATGTVLVVLVAWRAVVPRIFAE